MKPLANVCSNGARAEKRKKKRGSSELRRLTCSKTTVMAGAQQWLDGRRTVVVSGVPAPLPPSRMADKLTIHFQSRRRSAGGDVEGVTYPTDMDGVAFVTFDRAEGKLARG